MNIDSLINKYFEGATTSEEERYLRRFFAEEPIPDHLKVYRPLFAYFEQEIEQNKNNKPTTLSVRKTKKHGWYVASGIAAGLLLAITVAGMYKYYSNNTDCYVIIDGKRYTDAQLAQEEAQAAFQDVAISEDEVFARLFNE